MTTPATEHKEEVNLVLRDVTEFEEHVRELPCETPEDAEYLSDLLQATGKKYKELEERRLKITRPLDDAKNEVMSLFKAPKQMLKAAESALKAKLATYHAALRESQQKAVEDAAKKGDTRAMARAARTQTKTKGVRTKEVVMWKVKDGSKIPAKYYKRVLDTEAIDEAVENGKKVPGIATWTETKVARTGR